MTFRTELDGLKTGLQTAINKRVKLEDLNLTTPEEILDRTKHTGVQPISTVDGLETRLTDIETLISAVDQIDDTQTLADKTWSSNKISSEIQSNVSGLIDDATASETKVFSSSKIDNELTTVNNALATLASTVDSINTTLQLEVAQADIAINDTATSLLETWSSEKINNQIQTINQAVTALINDTVTNTDSTWSSDKINTELGNLATVIATKATVTTEDMSDTAAWSATKSYNNMEALSASFSTQLSDALTAANQKTSVSDSETVTDKTWSSSKIAEEIQNVSSAAAAGTIDDAQSSATTTYSSVKLDTELASKAVIDDVAIESTTSTYSVTKLVETFAGLNSAISAIGSSVVAIDDTTPALGTVYSSAKVEDLLAGVNTQITELRTDLDAAISELRTLIESL